MRRHPTRRHRRRPGRCEADPVADPDEAAERAAYNNYLAELAARDKPKQWR